MKNPTKRALGTVSSAANDEAVDARFERSPYASSCIILCSSDGQEFLIPQSLIPELPGLDPTNRTLQVNATQAVLHVLAHHLFTNTYQCLRPGAKSSLERAAAEFSIAARVRTLAREYHLSVLEQLAMVEMEALSDQLDFSAVLSLLQNVYTEPSREDTWLSNFVKLRLMLLVQKSSETEHAAQEMEPRPFSLGDLVLKCLRELADEGNIVACQPNATLAIRINGYESLEKPVRLAGSQASQGEPHHTSPKKVDLTRLMHSGEQSQETLGPESGSRTPSSEYGSPEDEVAFIQNSEGEKGRTEEEEREEVKVEMVEIAAEEAIHEAPAADEQPPDDEAPAADEPPVADEPPHPNDVTETTGVAAETTALDAVEVELAALQSTWRIKGKLSYRHRERYELLFTRAQERRAELAKVAARGAEEAAAREAEEAAVRKAEEELAAQVAAEEDAELALLEAKKLRKGRLGLKKDRERYTTLLERAEERRAAALQPEGKILIPDTATIIAAQTSAAQIVPEASPADGYFLSY